MKDWIKRTNIYEVNLRQYTAEGTLKAFRPHLPRLKDMGVETLWFMPLTPIAQKNKKGTLGSYYACSDYTSVSAEFGTLEEFKALVQEAHDLGMKVILDWVANHTGWDHWWTEAHPDWYEKDEHTGDFKKASGMDDIIELDFSNPELRKAMIEALKFWVRETDIDGYRCDLAFWVELYFWQEAIPEVNQLKPLFWLAEMDPLEHPDYMQVFDAAYTWQWMHKTEKFHKRELSFGDLLDVLRRYNEGPGLPAWFTSNHDENTWNGTEYEKYGALAMGLAVFSCTWPGLPLVYSGQELPNHKRLQFFEKDAIEWKEEKELHHFYKTLFTLRRQNPALGAGAPLHVWKADPNTPVLIFERRADARRVVVALNFSEQQQQVRIAEPGQGALLHDVFTGEPFATDHEGRLVLPPWGYRVFQG